MLLPPDFTIPSIDSGTRLTCMNFELDSKASDAIYSSYKKQHLYRKQLQLETQTHETNAEACAKEKCLLAVAP